MMLSLFLHYPCVPTAATRSCLTELVPSVVFTEKDRLSRVLKIDKRVK
jgi:hypothetical protein